MQKRQKIKIGISSCLLGEHVRFDGGHKRDHFIAECLSTYFNFVPICPEVGIGLGVPRQPIHLVGSADDHKALGVNDKDLDVTEDLIQYAYAVKAKLEQVSGYIFKSNSPSCGVEGVKLFTAEAAQPIREGVGLYAKTVIQLLPYLPIEEEERLKNPALRDNFIERIFVYRRWQNLIKQKVTASKLIDFYTQHKLTVLSRGQRGYLRIGRLVSSASEESTPAIADQFIADLMMILKRPATRRNHTNVLQHLQGFLKTKLDKRDKQELTASLEQYRLGHLPWIAPITLLRHHFGRHPDPYIARQIYLYPHPAELMLRNFLMKEDNEMSVLGVTTP